MTNDKEDGVDNFFTKEERRILDKTMSIREDIVDFMTKDGVPEKTNEIRVVKEVIESMDKKVLDSANLRAKVNKDEDDTSVSKLVVETLLEHARMKEQKHTVNRELDTSGVIEPDDILLGELEIDPTELEVDMFIDKKED